MSINTFLYRRLARWVTCELTLPFEISLALKSKYMVASFQDVFCHPFYWQLYNLVTTAPQLVVDCGANCGHFSLLAELCFRTKFGTVDTEYILVEPNSKILPTLRSTLAAANFMNRAQVHQALLGRKSGADTLWIHSKNYLSARVSPNKGAKPTTINYIDLSTIVNDRTIDVMKVDIEGSEYEFVRANLDLFRQVNLVLMELHDGSELLNAELVHQLNSVLLEPILGPLQYGEHKIVILQRKTLLT